MTEEKLGFPAFLDLRDSTLAWYQDPDLAEQLIGGLRTVVESAVPKWNGGIGNFTGDGFLLLFDHGEKAVRCLAEIIDAWEPIRVDFRQRFERADAPFPDAMSLALRTGVALGNYRTLDWNPPAVAGSPLNLAQRCETASKPYFDDPTKLSLPGKPWQRVFVMHAVYEAIGSHAGFHAQQRETEFRGANLPGSSTPARQMIWALWPKAATAPSRVPQRDEARNCNLAQAQTAFEVAVRLQEAARGRHGAVQRPLLDRAVTAYREALKVYTLDAAPVDYAMTQNNLGIALRDQAGLLAGEARSRRLEEAVAAYREALKVRTLDAAPVDYAATQNNLGNALRDQAGLLAGEARARRLEEAVAAYREALKVYTPKDYPHEHRLFQGNLERAERELSAP